ncbi:uncharacterized protein TRAVEDRAFT_64384 [Trametes versicolor FP-101664 SS1]|uniref:uncharacterized protein n=1 Tax=Trametes versicolor (strain FP-101664) TaxID=717944 RepID=UPI0004622D7F|nr:uncharacterized protein TRAVEDRAFT_64384 [Trametes versicolor FP-101664 SS1]EIW59225.1 hypothetical protein TRAVEDRAFT_64384 [Trametes versicolor FP-101664 SS1]
MSSPPLSLSRFDTRDDDSASTGHSSIEVIGQLHRVPQENVLATLDLETLSNARYGLSDGGHSSQGRIPSDLETTQLGNSNPRQASENSIDRNLSDRAFSEGWLSQARMVGSSQGSWQGSVQTSERVVYRQIEGSDGGSLANILRSNSTSSLRSNAGSSVQGVPAVHDQSASAPSVYGQSASAPSVHDQSGSEHPSSSPDSSFLTAPSHKSSSSSAAAIVPRAPGTPSVRSRSSAPSDSDREQRRRSPLTSGIASPTSSVAGGDENSAKSRHGPRARACSAPPGDAGARKYPRRAPVQTIRDISSGEVSFDTGLSIPSSPILGPDAETLKGYKRAMKTAEESLANERRERPKEIERLFRVHASDLRRIEEGHAAIVRRFEESLKREREEREAEVRREKEERANEVGRLEETLKQEREREREERANEVRRFEESLKREREEREAEVRREKEARANEVRRLEEARANEVRRLEEMLEGLKKTLEEAREEKSVLFKKLLEKV